MLQFIIFKTKNYITIATKKIINNFLSTLKSYFLFVVGDMEKA